MNNLTRATILSLTGPAQPPLTRATILQLEGEALSIAVNKHVAGYTELVHGWMRPHENLNQVAWIERNSLTETQQRAYGRILTDLLFDDDDWTDTSVAAGERRVYETATASPTTRCHALLLAVVAPEE